MRILAIEDEPRILGFLSRGLSAEGFTVDGARDGSDGLRRALSEEYDLVVLDLLLPKIDGLRVLGELRRRGRDLPVVIVSARCDLPTKLRGFSLGANDFVSKPFAFDELLARVRVHLRQAGAVPADENVLTLGALVLDLGRRQARIGAHVADLSEREFHLLHCLAQHRDCVVSRERLLSEVWGYHFDPRSNVVDVCVRRLRRKLGPHTPIETVRHAGYRLSTA